MHDGLLNNLTPYGLRTEVEYSLTEDPDRGWNPATLLPDHAEAATND